MSEGRPTSMTPETLEKLREAFLMGYNDKEACIFANIAPSTLYKYQVEHPEFSEQKEEYKKGPILKAKSTIYNNLDNVGVAKWYLERKASSEFSVKTDGNNGHNEINHLFPLIDKLNKQVSLGLNELYK